MKRDGGRTARVSRLLQGLISMEGRKGGISTPSYKHVVATRVKKPIENERGSSEEGKRNIEEEQDGTKLRENNSTKENEEEDKKQRTKDKAQKGPCKPKAEITPRVVLNDPALQVHRDHTQTYAIICKFMGLWPTKKA